METTTTTPLPPSIIGEPVDATAPARSTPSAPAKRERRPGIKDRIAVAESATEVDALLLEGHNYLAAAPKTRRSWEQMALRRKEELARK